MLFYLFYFYFYYFLYLKQVPYLFYLLSSFHSESFMSLKSFFVYWGGQVVGVKKINKLTDLDSSVNDLYNIHSFIHPFMLYTCKLQGTSIFSMTYHKPSPIKKVKSVMFPNHHFPLPSFHRKDRIQRGWKSFLYKISESNWKSTGSQCG